MHGVIFNAVIAFLSIAALAAAMLAAKLDLTRPCLDHPVGLHLKHGAMLLGLVAMGMLLSLGSSAAYFCAAALFIALAVAIIGGSLILMEISKSSSYRTYAQREGGE